MIQLCENLAEVVSQINVTMRGDIEIRFLDEEKLKEFLKEYPSINIGDQKITCGKRIPDSQINYFHYNIRFLPRATLK